MLSDTFLPVADCGIGTI